MNKRYLVLAAVAVTVLAAGGIVMLAQPQQDGPPQAPMTFFVTSMNNTGNLGGLAGADYWSVVGRRVPLGGQDAGSFS